MSQAFRVALTSDFFDSAGTVQFQDVGLSVFQQQPHIEVIPMTGFYPSVKPDQFRGCNAAILMDSGADRETVSESQDLLALCRFGVGYNDIDVRACTDADVCFFTCAGAVDRSMAEATVGWMIALGHHYRMKDLIVRTGRWNETPRYMGIELRDRVFGAVGLGGIARATIDLLRGFGMAPPLAFDPYASPADAERAGVELTTLDDLLSRADFVSIHCPLNDRTRNLIGARELALMKSEAYLINTARGGIVNEDALYDALKALQIAGAAMDVFVGEPFDQPHRFGDLDNVLLAPHAVGWTHELFRDIGRAACQGIVDLTNGQRPRSVINPEVFERYGFQEKWKRLRFESK
jgi:phosphoglycerate dehydrogenase-like enzyme